MQHKNKKEKNIIGEIKDNEHYILKPNISLGRFELGKNIESYSIESFTFIAKSHEEDLWDTYELKNPNIEIYTDTYRVICSIRCNYKCIYKGKNLIGMNYQEIVEHLGFSPDDEDTIYVIRKRKGQNQKVFEFDRLGLQVWIYRSRVVTVFCNNRLQ